MNNCWIQSNFRGAIATKEARLAHNEKFQVSTFCIILHCFAYYAIQILYCILCRIPCIVLHYIATAQCTTVQRFSAIETDFIDFSLGGKMRCNREITAGIQQKLVTVDVLRRRQPITVSTLLWNIFIMFWLQKYILDSPTFKLDSSWCTERVVPLTHCKSAKLTWNHNWS